MAITIGKPYAGLRASETGGNLLFVPREGFCDGIVLNTPYVGLRVASTDGQIVYAVSDQKLASDGKLILNKPYIGLLAGVTDGKQLFVVPGKQCDAGGGIITDCYGCVRAGTCTLSISKPLHTGGICNPVSSGGLPVSYSCDGTFSYSGTMTWSTKTYQGIEVSPYSDAPCPEGFDGVVCGDFCWQLCEVTRTGYWSEEIIEEEGQCFYCDPETGEGVCGEMRHVVVRYVLYPSCNDLGEQAWVLERIIFSEESCGGIGNVIADPSLAPCHNVDCQLEVIDTLTVEDCEPITFSAAADTIIIIEDELPPFDGDFFDSDFMG